MDIASGVAGLIKAALAVRTGLIAEPAPPSAPTRHRFRELSVLLNTRLSSGAAPPGRGGRRERVRCQEGTNAHVILEEAPPSRGLERVPPRLLVLSARTPAALDAAAANPPAISPESERDLGNVAFTLQEGRRHFAHRRAFVCLNTVDAASGPAPSGNFGPRGGAAGVRDLRWIPVSRTGVPAPGMAGRSTRASRCFRESRSLLQTARRRPARTCSPFSSSRRRGEARRRARFTARGWPSRPCSSSVRARAAVGAGASARRDVGHSLGEFVAATSPACLRSATPFPSSPRAGG